jgi:hypothetical protein
MCHAVSVRAVLEEEGHLRQQALKILFLKGLEITGLIDWCK